MDSLYHQSQKYLLDLQQIAHPSTTTPTTTSGTPAPPPAYTPNPPPRLHTYAHAESNHDSDSDSDCDADSDLDPSSPHTITLTASTTIHGSFNLINPDFSTAMGARIATALCAALSSHTSHPVVTDESDGHRGTVPAVPKAQLLRPLRINVDCGVKIVGDRNVVGSVRLVQGRGAAAAAGGGSNVGPSGGGSSSSSGVEERGGKRKAEDDGETAIGAKRVKDEV